MESNDNLKNLKVWSVTDDVIYFENNIELYSYHESYCCESHYLSMSDLTIDDFEGLEFDLTNDNFFKRIENYGIELIPIKGHSVKIPGYGSNNGYYSSQLELLITNQNDFRKIYDVSECQVINND